jgi:hypothetical protein
MFCKFCGEDTGRYINASPHVCGREDLVATHCMGCGAEVGEDAAFCYLCSTPVGEPPVTSAGQPLMHRSVSTLDAGEGSAGNPSSKVPGHPRTPIRSSSPSPPATMAAPHRHQGFSVLAVASFIMSLYFSFGLEAILDSRQAWLSLITSLLAVLLGVWAIARIKSSRWQQGGRWLAIAGILIGAWGTFASWSDLHTINQINNLLPHTSPQLSPDRSGVDPSRITIDFEQSDSIHFETAIAVINLSDWHTS